MNDNRKLIEEARAWRDAGWFRVDNPTSASIITRLADALEAAEKAKTPPGDEREAMRRIIAQGIIADLMEWSRPLGNSPAEETLRLVIERIERAPGGAR